MAAIEEWSYPRVLALIGRIDIASPKGPPQGIASGTSGTTLRKQKRRVPVGVEPVAILNGISVSVFHPLAPHQRRYQHEQI
jgi:hypothetical protein